jgi:hypothetical protein
LQTHRSYHGQTQTKGDADVDPRKLVPDEHGRITLGDLARGVSSFEVTEEDGVITLRPMVEVPRSALWAQSFELREFTVEEANAIQKLIDAPPPPTPHLRAAMKRHTAAKQT